MSLHGKLSFCPIYCLKMLNAKREHCTFIQLYGQVRKYKIRYTILAYAICIRKYYVDNF